MNEINEWIESMLMDIGSEGVGMAAGIGLMWGCFFGGAFVSFQRLLELLVSTV